MSLRRVTIVILSPVGLDHLVELDQGGRQVKVDHIRGGQVGRQLATSETQADGADLPVQEAPDDEREGGGSLVKNARLAIVYYYSLS